ncbi:PDZ domain-containing protein [Caulifigura coniformis]|uniref:PDZ domain-containing protein n=1 Tax=Caulifigura coniformis TaxID=2527983 RepID=UPI0011AABD66|nr:PDZ domain-containing protein [Caulifigura coniformis]
MLIAAVGLGLSTSTASAAEDAQSSSINALLRRMTDPRFEVRTAAERELSRLDPVQTQVLEEAATKDSEHAARIVSLLERLYVGQSAPGPEETSARPALLSSLDVMLTIRRGGDFGETEVTRAAEKSLSRLAEGDSPAAPIAEAALARHAVLAENRAIATLRRLGAKVVFSDLHDPMHDALGQLAEGADTDAIAGDSSPPALLKVEHVYILRNWTGGKEGLEYLTRLRITGGLQLYLVDGCGIRLEDTLALKAAIPGLAPIERSAATLGVRSSGYQFSENGGCEIASVTEGLAADRAGLRTNFVIKAVNGDPILTFDDGTSKSLVHRLRDCKPGETVILSVQKSSNVEPMDVEVKLSDWSDVPDVQIMNSYR